MRETMHISEQTNANIRNESRILWILQMFKNTVKKHYENYINKFDTLDNIENYLEKITYNCFQK